MFLIDQANLSPQDVTDAVGELTNMIGGNVKSLFGHECGLGFPSVQSEDLLNLGGEAVCVNSQHGTLRVVIEENQL